MKNISIILCLLFLYKISYSQISDNTYKRNELNIYYQALKQYFQYDKSRFNQPYDTVYIEDDFKVTDSILSMVENIKIISLTKQELQETLKLKKGITLYRIFPVKYENSKFSIDIVPYGVGYKKGKIKYLYGGGIIVFFTFDGIKFLLERVELRGI